MAIGIATKPSYRGIGLSLVLFGSFLPGFSSHPVSSVPDSFYLLFCSPDSFVPRLPNRVLTPSISSYQLSYHTWWLSLLIRRNKVVKYNALEYTSIDLRRTSAVKFHLLLPLQFS